MTYSQKTIYSDPYYSNNVVQPFSNKGEGKVTNKVQKYDRTMSSCRDLYVWLPYSVAKLNQKVCEQKGGKHCIITNVWHWYENTDCNKKKTAHNA